MTNTEKLMMMGNVTQHVKEIPARNAVEEGGLAFTDTVSMSLFKWQELKVNGLALKLNYIALKPYRIF